MEKIQNNFKISGFVGYSEVRSFDTASVCRFSISVSRKEKGKDDYTSAFMNVEAWKKNDMEELDSFKYLAKGNLVQIEGFIKPEEWEDEQGQKHNKIVFVANKFEQIVTKKPEAKKSETKKKTSKKK
ncbi:MAG: single-stranded DNA-binding protein [Lachnospiraceae bacterium]|nr:single-stranded DNA-binding protein [Lachnospiraceae bacterium]